ncbi:nucleoside/nucleotide kinase family protein [Actinophytocola sediminis]
MRAERAILGICGPPGAGKSTLAERLATELGPGAAHLGMDGFHLAKAELDRLDRTARKGAPDTFDAAGYVHLLDRLKTNPANEIVYAPRFRRDLEEPIACAVPIAPEIRLVVTEGNYLLLPDDPWRRVRPLLDECWFLAPEENLRRTWLRYRHEAYGRTPEEADERTLGSDERNAVLINATRDTADLVIPTPVED